MINLSWTPNISKRLFFTTRFYSKPTTTKLSNIYSLSTSCLPHTRVSGRLLGTNIPNVTARDSIQVEILDNGLTLAMANLPGSSNTATVGVWLKFGSRDENTEQNGTVHFLEHMTFKGTKSRQKNEIERYVENIGAHLNAYTSKEHVAYLGNCLTEKVPNMINLIGDLLQHSTLNPRQVEEEKNVILRESAEVNSIHEEVLMDKIHEQCFPDQALGRMILGTDEKISDMTTARLKSFIKNHYTPENMIVIVAGDFDRLSVIEECKKSFKRRTGKTLNPSPKAVPVMGDISLHVDELMDPYMTSPLLMMGVTGQGVSWTDRRLFASMVGRSMLGGLAITNGEVSNQANAFRGSKVRVPSTLAIAQKFDERVFFDAYYRDCGLLGMYCALDPGDLTGAAAGTEVLEILKKSGLKVCNDVNESLENWSNLDLDKGKEAVLNLYAQAWDCSVTVCEEIGRQILFYPNNNGVQKYDWFAKKIDQVNMDDVRSVVKDALTRPSQVAITGLLRFPPSNGKDLLF